MMPFSAGQISVSVSASTSGEESMNPKVPLIENGSSPPNSYMMVQSTRLMTNACATPRVLLMPAPRYMIGYPLGSSAPAPLKVHPMNIGSRVCLPVTRSRKYT